MYFIYIYIYIYVCMYVYEKGIYICEHIKYIDYIYISNTQSASEDSGCGLFTYRIYEEFHINLWEFLMYGYCYIFFPSRFTKQNSHTLYIYIYIYIYETCPLYIYIYIYIFMKRLYMCVFVCVCVWERVWREIKKHNVFVG